MLSASTMYIYKSPLPEQFVQKQNLSEYNYHKWTQLIQLLFLKKLEI